MATTTFRGPVRTGQNVGNPTFNTLGTVLLTQETTVSRTNSVAGATQIARLPENSDAIDFIVTVVSAFSGASAGVGEVDIRIGTTASETLFGTIRASSAGHYRLVTGARVSAGTGWRNLSGGSRIITAMVTAVGSATATGLAIIRTIYSQRS